MSHLVKPVSFRVGKTFPWQHNTLLTNSKKLVTGNLTLAKGLTRVSKILLKRKRFYAVHGAIAGRVSGKINYRLICVPRIKTKRRERASGWFLRKLLYKPINLETSSKTIKHYVYLKWEKLLKRVRRKKKPRQLNKWLTKRMFRGSSRLHWKFNRNKNLLDSINNNSLLLPLSPVLKGFDKKLLKKIHKRCVVRRVFWKEKWLFDKIKRRRLNDRKFSSLVTRLTYLPIKIQIMNLFAYLALKKAVNYKTHQNHFWNFTYRRYRFQYKNYYDIANAFFALSLLDHTEDFLLSILKKTLPVILKIKKFFRFLNALILNMPELRDKFSLFKLNIAGKLAGGTKRTKAHSIGYGTLDVQTLEVITYNNFFSYRHVYGEFGVKLLMRKDLKHYTINMLS